MYIVIGKSNCVNCEDLTPSLNRKGIQYTYLHQRYVHSDILDQCSNCGCMFYPFVLEVKTANNIDELIQSITTCYRFFYNLL